MSKYSVSKITAHVPDLQDIQKVLSDGLPCNFSNVSVNVVDCPDLTQSPFHLSSQGLCGNARLVDVGGPPYLLPLVQRDKIYNFKTIAEHAELPNAFMIGAGAGPAHVVGVNSELMNNVKYENGKVTNNAYIAKVDTKMDEKVHIWRKGLKGLTYSNTHLNWTNKFVSIPALTLQSMNIHSGGCILEKPNSEDFWLMGNFLVSDGKPGQVIEVRASKRCGEENFVSCLKKVLKSHYGDKPVALGGVFLVEKGSAHLHIMPDFSATPLTTPASVDDWLNYYDMKPTLVCVGELVSHDPGYDLRDEHFHCFSMHGEGGHYHWDTTPEDVEYRGYFVLADYVYRIDQPPKAP